MATDKFDLRQRLWRELGPVIEKASPLAKLGWMLLGSLGMAAIGSAQAPAETPAAEVAPMEAVPLPAPLPCETCGTPRLAGNVFCHSCGWRLGARFIDPFALPARPGAFPVRSSRSGR